MSWPAAMLWCKREISWSLDCLVWLSGRWGWVCSAKTGSSKGANIALWHEHRCQCLWCLATHPRLPIWPKEAEIAVCDTTVASAQCPIFIVTPAFIVNQLLIALKKNKKRLVHINRPNTHMNTYIHSYIYIKTHTHKHTMRYHAWVGLHAKSCAGASADHWMIRAPRIFGFSP